MPPAIEGLTVHAVFSQELVTAKPYREIAIAVKRLKAQTLLLLLRSVVICFKGLLNIFFYLILLFVLKLLSACFTNYENTAPYDLV